MRHLRTRPTEDSNPKFWPPVPIPRIEKFEVLAVLLALTTSPGTLVIKSKTSLMEFSFKKLPLYAETESGTL